MRDLSPDIIAALQARDLMARDFLWLTARDRITGDPVSDGHWSDYGPFTAEVIDPNTGNIIERTYNGVAGLVSISSIPLVANITVRSATIVMSQVNSRVEQIVREYDCDQAGVQIHRGIFDPKTHNLVAPAVCRFVGFVDFINISTPAEGGEGGVEFTCKSHTQEMTRSNPDTRSHESQQLRLEGDGFFKDAAVVGEWQMFWGKTSDVLQTVDTSSMIARARGLL